jgi:hypothetical protein
MVSTVEQKYFVDYYRAKNFEEKSFRNFGQTKIMIILMEAMALVYVFRRYKLLFWLVFHQNIGQQGNRISSLWDSHKEIN